MNSWVRLWLDMPNDPKWRTIARVSGASISEVVSVFIHMMCEAGANATERGRTQPNGDEHIASALDLPTDKITAIREAMQGRVLDGDYLTGWERRQPKREDGSAERAKQWRAEKQAERKRTQTNANERPDADADTDTDDIGEVSPITPLPTSLSVKHKEPVKQKKAQSRGTRLEQYLASLDPAIIHAASGIPIEWGRWAATTCNWDGKRVITVWDVFRDHWRQSGNSNGVKRDWLAAWRNCCRSGGYGGKAAHVAGTDKRAADRVADLEGWAEVLGYGQPDGFAGESSAGAELRDVSPRAPGQPTG